MSERFTPQEKRGGSLCHKLNQWSAVFLILLILLFLCPLHTFANTPQSQLEPLVRSQFKELDTAEIQAFWSQFQREYQHYFQRDLPSDLLDFAFSAQKGFSLKEILQAFAHYFFHELLFGSRLLGMIIVLTVLSMLLQTLQTAFERNQVSKVAYAIVFMVILILALQSFSTAIGTARSAIERMIDFMLATVPLLLTLLATLGNMGTVALFHPIIVFMIHVVGVTIYLLVLPMLFFATVLSIVSTISDKYQVNRLAHLLRQISLTLLGGLLTLFLGVVSVQGATAAVTDGLVIRTAKYLTGNFVPIIGRTISDAADTVLGASLLVKNSVGLVGLFLLLFICAFPALKILSMAFIYHFSAALLQPLGNSPIIESLYTIGRTLLYVFAALAIVGLMFFLSITLLITVGNLSVMMR
jgi:stage III sporulation protein AE